MTGIEELKGIAAFLSSLWRCEVTTFQVWRAIRRRKDPLPARKPLGRWVADVEALRAWGERQPIAATATAARNAS